ncbi:motility associated factor glycosyltransferase family protein [Niallia circulans]|uniref:motility associated factor glycosyltransferase family protein n=1 Tax=Niallia circulans TaxID=1397 RepID=UPI0035263A4D
MGENQKLLMNMFPYLRSSLNTLNNETDEEKLEILHTKVENTPTLSVTIENRNFYLHSKYDPRKEAEVLIERYKDEFEKYDHVLFYGVGLGYHVETLLKRYPNMNYSLFEPVPSVFYQFLESNRLDNLDLSRLKNVFIDTADTDPKDFLINLTGNIQERIMLIALPSYERIFERKFQQFTEDFKAAVTAKYESNYIDNKFSARWTLNSLLNLPVTLTSPNILGGFETVFKDKPLIIVSAGPSLEEEYENLRKIKEQKTAFIFAVGSANKALIANGIIPDAVCTYDPQDINYSVFTKMLEENVTDVPMIYGTSVGFETLKYYPGPKLHMITSQDTVSPYYIRYQQQSMKRINDAPTIAAITLQLVCELGCNPVILVGQNLALKGEAVYSTGIKEIKEEIVKDNFVLVEDVHGNLIKSTKGFINMKNYLEQYLSSYKNIEVINATNGGAAIKGSKFIPLEVVMEKYLIDKVVEKEWYKKQKSTSYVIDTSISKSKLMEQSIHQYRKLYKQLIKYLQVMEELVKKNQIKKLNSTINVFNEKMKQFFNNECYQIFIHPINRIQYQALTIKAAEMRKVEDVVQKARLVIDSFSLYLDRCKQTLEQISGCIYDIHHKIDSIGLSGQFYPADCGVFYYEGKWIKESYSPGKTIDYSVKQMVSKGTAIIRFKFTGTKLKLFGSKGKIDSKKFELTIDGHTESISVNNNIFHGYPLKINAVVFEKDNLSNSEHHVVIRFTDENSFWFTGVEIDQAGRLFHINEVTDIKHLEIGKRIRCHYKAEYNTVGEFSDFGQETKEFIPPESAAFPDGDFYFIMVDEVDGAKRLIADRNVQHNISWVTLLHAGVVEKSKCVYLFDKYKLNFGLTTGGSLSSTDMQNDWDKYIQKNVNDFLIEHLSWQSEQLACHRITRVQHILLRGKYHKEYNYRTIGTATNTLDIACYLPLVIISNTK